MITTGDVGEEHNIHPLDKRTVAQRLFAAAQSTVYGKDNEYCGPVATSAVFTDDRKIVVGFDHAKQGLLANDNVNNVYVSDQDDNFFEAKAYTRENILFIECEAVLASKAVKMCCENYAVTNLYNTEGFPATPFYFEI